MCCSPWGCKGSDKTEWLNWLTEVLLQSENLPTSSAAPISSLCFTFFFFPHFQTSWSMKVRWGLERITIDEATGDDVIPAELFQIIKDDVVKGLHSLCQQIWKTQQWPQDKKNSDFTPIPKKGNAKECSNYCTIELVSYASKVMIKILQGRLQQYMNQTFQMYKLDLEKAEEPETKLPTSTGL